MTTLLATGHVLRGCAANPELKPGANPAEVPPGLSTVRVASCACSVPEGLRCFRPGLQSGVAGAAKDGQP